MEIGAQLYTIRNFCKTTEDFAESLKKIADIGYKTVQVSGTCAYEPQWLQEQLKKNDLRCVLTHTSPALMLEDATQVAANHDVFECQYVGIGGVTLTAENLENDLKTFFDTYKPVAEKLKAAGKYFMYHNHAKEFFKLNGETVMDILSREMPADAMGFTLDTFWVQVGGGDSAQWLEKLSGRVPCIHLKDYGVSDNARSWKMLPVGEGNINFDRVFEKAEAAGTKYMLVEQDDCNGEDPFDCLKRSHDYLRAQGF